MTADFKQKLSVFIHVTQEGRPSRAVVAHSGVKISEDEERPCVRNVSDGGAKVIIEFVFLICGGERVRA